MVDKVSDLKVKENSSERTIIRKVGKNIPGLIADLAESSKIASIEELVANSYDSDAQTVVIDYEEGNYLKVTDDGCGMSSEDLDNFFRIGDSVKLKEPISPKGRRRMGKFGIATLLISDLGR